MPKRSNDGTKSKEKKPKTLRYLFKKSLQDAPTTGSLSTLSTSSSLSSSIIASRNSEHLSPKQSLQNANLSSVTSSNSSFQSLDIASTTLRHNNNITEADDKMDFEAGCDNTGKEDIQQNEGRSESDSDTLPLSQSSTRSREGEVSNEDSAFLKSSIMQLHFRFIKYKEESKPDKLIYILQFGNDRPTTIVGSGQGRHISPYCLLQEALINRVNGKNIEEAPAILEKFLLEYINDKQQTLNALKDYVNLTKNKFKGYTFSKDQREAISTSMKVNNTFYSSLPKEFTKEQKKLLNKALGGNAYQLLKQANSANRKLSSLEISIQRTRDQLKQGNIAAEQEVLLETIKGVLTVLNKMEMVSFSGKKTGEDMGKEGSNTREIMTRLRETNQDKSQYYNARRDLQFPKIASDMYELLDFSAEEIIQFWKNQWGKKKEVEWKKRWNQDNPVPKSEKENTEYLQQHQERRKKYLADKWKNEDSDIKKEKNKIIEFNIRKYFSPILQRHIKLICEASPIINEIFRDENKQRIILDDFLNKVMGSGKWEGRVLDISVDNLVQNLSKADSQYQLTAKFDTCISGSLANVVRELEENLQEAKIAKQINLMSNWLQSGNQTNNTLTSAASSSPFNGR